MRIHIVSICLVILEIVAASGLAEPAALWAAEPAAGSTPAAEAREKIWNSPEMLQARAWLENYFRVSRQYTPQQAAAYRKTLANMSAAEMELWLMRFEYDRRQARAQEAAFNQQRRAAVAGDEVRLARERQALQAANEAANRAADVNEKAVAQQQAEADRNYRQNAAEQSRLIDEFNRPYVPYFYGGYYGPSTVHYHFHR